MVNNNLYYRFTNIGFVHMLFTLEMITTNKTSKVVVNEILLREMITTNNKMIS